MDQEETAGAEIERGAESRFLRRVLLVIGLGALALISLLFIEATARLLLLLFGGVLLGLVLGGVSDWLSARTRLRRGWALALLVLALLGAAALTGTILAHRIAAQIGALRQSLPGAVEALEQRLRQYPWGGSLLAQAPSASESFARLRGAFSSTLAALGGLLLIFVVGLYIAAEPGLYSRGLVRLFPPKHRPRAQEVLSELATTLRYWFLGQLFAMAVVGLLTGLGLWLLGSPLALALGLLAALFDFVPNFGPIVAAIPAVLLALQDGANQALYVGLLYLGVQLAEGYLITPLVQKRAVDIPPVLLIGAQLALGILLGVVGVLFAAPLAAGLLVLGKMLYLEGTLGEEVELPGDPSSRKRLKRRARRRRRPEEPAPAELH